MSEEINRVLSDRVANLVLCPTQTATGGRRTAFPPALALILSECRFSRRRGLRWTSLALVHPCIFDEIGFCAAGFVIKAYLGLDHRSGQRPPSGVQGFSLGPLHPRLKPWTPLRPEAAGTMIKAACEIAPHWVWESIRSEPENIAMPSVGVRHGHWWRIL